MLPVSKDTLPAAQLDKLAAKQKKIDDLADYPDRVKRAAQMWDNKGDFKEIRKALKEQCSGLERCQYCEDGPADEIEHVWPKNYYPEKTFVWCNYVYSCGTCNGSYKRDRWALFATTDEYIKLERERGCVPSQPPDGVPVFLNPRQDNPLDFIELDFETGMFMPIAEEGSREYQRAEYTIELLGLNSRDLLLRVRCNAYEDFLDNACKYLAVKGLDEKKAEAELRRLRERSQATVWAEIKRLAKAGLKHQDIFAQAPELWQVG